MHTFKLYFFILYFSSVGAWQVKFIAFISPIMIQGESIFLEMGLAKVKKCPPDTIDSLVGQYKTSPQVHRTSYNVMFMIYEDSHADIIQ